MKSLVTDDMKLLLSTKDAAKLCGCTPRLWRLWHRMGYTPMPIMIGKRHYWKIKELETWIAVGCPKREIWVQSQSSLCRKADDSSCMAKKVTSVHGPRGLRKKVSE